MEKNFNLFRAAFVSLDELQLTYTLHLWSIIGYSLLFCLHYMEDIYIYLLA